MKNVLIVDDEKSFLRSLVEGLVLYAADFNTLTAYNGRVALEILKANAVDLVVTDLKMPEVDGFELLAYLTKHHADIPVIVMTAYCTPEIKARIETLGSFKVLEKPLDFKELVDSIMSALTTTSKGYLKGITLPAFLQLVEMEQKTCTLTVRSKGQTGHLYFMNGTLVGADDGISEGEEAALRIVCWDDVEIEIKSNCRERGRSITTSLGHILFEGFRLKDEAGRRAAEAAAAAADDPQPAEAVAVELLDEDDTTQTLSIDVDEKEVRMAGLKDVLNEFAKLQGVDAVCLVGRDGFLLDSIARTGIDTEMIGAIASSGFGAADSMGRQLGKGVMSISMIEFEKGPVLFSPVGDDAFLVIIAEKDSNLGMIRLKLKKHSGELALAAAF